MTWAKPSTVVTVEDAHGEIEVRGGDTGTPHVVAGVDSNLYEVSLGDSTAAYFATEEDACDFRELLIASWGLGARRLYTEVDMRAFGELVRAEVAEYGSDNDHVADLFVRFTKLGERA
jgi:hypothetical protein